MRGAERKLVKSFTFSKLLQLNVGRETMNVNPGLYDVQNQLQKRDAIVLLTEAKQFLGDT